HPQVVTQLPAALSNDAKAFSALAAAGRSENGAAYTAAVRQVSASSRHLATSTHAFAAYELPMPQLSAVRPASAHPARPPVSPSGGSTSSVRSSSAGPNTS